MQALDMPKVVEWTQTMRALHTSIQNIMEKHSLHSKSNFMKGALLTKKGTIVDPTDLVEFQTPTFW